MKSLNKPQLLKSSWEKWLPIAIKRKEDQKAIMLISYYLLYFEFPCLTINLFSRTERPVGLEKNYRFVIFCILLHVHIFVRINKIAIFVIPLADSPIFQ